ncbi:MAG: HEPN domain-containing protein [Candidatus Aenigmatarchaeota archaeon]
MEVLKKRSKEFFKKALESFEKGEFNFVMFFCEQAIQLFLKYLIAEKFGEFPKTHSLKKLIEILNEEKYKRFFEENKEILNKLEVAYVLSRYYDFEYSKKDAENAINVCKKLIEEND